MSTLLLQPTITTVLTVGQGPSGPPGPPGPAGPASGAGAEYTAAVPLSGHCALALDAQGQAIYASADTPAHALALGGVSLGAAAAGAPITARLVGVVEHSGWAWTPGQPVFLGLGGALTQTVPVGAVFVAVLGQAISATRLALQLQPPVFIS